ncbi:MAG: GNAT family N-acetyltransferase [Roseiflexaceae bacterium]
MSAYIAYDDPSFTHTLADGSIVRWAQPDDVQGYIDLCANVFKDSADSEYNRYVAKYCRDFTSKYHPLSSANELAVVVNPAGTVVAGTVLMRVPIDYAGIELSMGKPEVVATHPDYRNRGYVREIFKLLHARSHARGDLVQCITGIPYIYERLGYHYALEYEQRSTIHFASTSVATTSDITVRRARTDEYAEFAALYDAERTARQQMITTPISNTYFHYLLSDNNSIHAWQPMFICQTTTQQIIGFMLLYKAKIDNKYIIYGLGLKPGYPLAQYLPALINASMQFRQHITIRHTQDETIDGIVFDLDATHPAHQLLPTVAHSAYDEGYSLYIRVPDLQQLLLALRPVLEQRVAQSDFHGLTHQLVVSLYDAVLTFDWQHGMLHSIAHTMQPKGVSAPNRYTLPLLLKQVFGRNSYAEMRRWHHELDRNAFDGALLDTMFPKQTSCFLFQY